MGLVKNSGEVSDLNTARDALAGDGTSTLALVTGGHATATTNITEQWDGSSWTEVADMATARWGVAGAGTTTAFVAMGGYKPPGNTASDLTEEFTVAAAVETVAVD